MTAAAHLLDIRELAVSYGDGVPPTIADVNITLDNGRTLAIVGESGSGKTTVIRAALGLLPGEGRISHGTMHFAGEDLLQYTPEQWRKLRGKEISMIFQDSGNMMNPIQTVGHQYIEYIRVHADMTHDEAYARAAEMLTRMNLQADTVMQSYPFELSGGMRQRVGIAMAITFRPQLLLADEPTSALDVTTQAQIVEELMYVCRELGTALIIVTHNIGVAAHMAHDLMVMAGGKVIEYGPTMEIITHPSSAYTRSLLSAVPELGGRRYA